MHALDEVLGHHVCGTTDAEDRPTRAFRVTGVPLPTHGDSLLARCWYSWEFARSYAANSYGVCDFVHGHPNPKNHARLDVWGYCPRCGALVASPSDEDGVCTRY